MFVGFMKVCLMVTLPNGTWVADRGTCETLRFNQVEEETNDACVKQMHQEVYKRPLNESVSVWCKPMKGQGA